ncbi:sorting and assembly machinery component 50 homolog B-like [Adelges cooleyi]|uniref:sorting and assembly machinery component 50 homolog B-like n=1 Tax=Adelges cooleyi TaxID=133065 RepID=UPI00217F9B6A|nr:sorting and assembly machinery component 50 homolog B-like [Adelges cooleyi]
MRVDIDPAVSDHPIRIDRVKVVGLNRTKDDIVTKTTRNLFESRTLNEAVSKIVETKKNLMRLDCFNKVSSTLDMESVDGRDSYFVTINVEESNWIKGRVNILNDVYQDSHDQPKLSTCISFMNLFRRGEKLAVSTDIYSTNKRFSTGMISFTKPLLAPYKPTLYLDIYKHFINKKKLGYFNNQYGLKTGITLEYDSWFLDLGWEGMIRNLQHVPNAPFGIREQLGLSMKSSLKMSASYDSRDSPVFPINGSLVQLISEVAGLGGSNNFFKNELILQKSIRLFLGTSLTGSFSLGLLEKMGKCSMVDNFYLGGPLTFRGFDDNGVGKNNDGSITGTTMFWRFNTHLHVPLPFLSDKNKLSHFIRIHMFMNSGNMGNRQADLVTDLKALFNSIRLSCGAGFAVHLNHFLRFELNYCLPIYYSSQDSVIPNRSQWGFGILFY